MKSKAAAGAVRKALAEITGCADAKKLLINEKTAAYFRSGLCEGDLVPGDVDALIATVKCMLQGWDACCDQQSSVALWPALCFQLTGWMCAAVRLFGDEEALARAMKNLQFSVSKGNKAEQVPYPFFYRSLYMLYSGCTSLSVFICRMSPLVLCSSVQRCWSLLGGMAWSPQGAPPGNQWLSWRRGWPSSCPGMLPRSRRALTTATSIQIS